MESIKDMKDHGTGPSQEQEGDRIIQDTDNTEEPQKTKAVKAIQDNSQDKTENFISSSASFEGSDSTEQSRKQEDNEYAIGIEASQKLLDEKLAGKNAGSLPEDSNNMISNEKESYIMGSECFREAMDAISRHQGKDASCTGDETDAEKEVGRDAFEREYLSVARRPIPHHDNCSSDECDTSCAGHSAGDIAKVSLKTADDEERQVSLPGAFPIDGIDEIGRRESTGSSWERGREVDSQPGAFSIHSRASGERPAWSLGRENEYESGEFNMAARSGEFSIAASMAVSSYSRNANDDIEQIVLEAEAVDESERIYATAKADPWWRRNQAWLAAAAVLIIIGTVLAVVVASRDLSEPDAPTPSPTSLQEGIQQSIRDLVLSQYPQTNFSDHTSAQSQAVQWVADVEEQDQDWYTDERVLRQYSLVKFFLSTSKGAKDNPSWHRSEGWMESNNECKWYGIKCDDSGYILSLELSDNNLDGEIQPELSVISKRLSTIDFSHNNLIGPIPEEIGNLSALKYLSLSSNALTGSISSSIGDLSSLVTVNLSSNRLTSVLPNDIGSLSMLESVDLGNNKLIGSIPSEIGTLDSIREINFQNNRLTYELPSEIGNLGSLEELNLQNNDLLGRLPSEMGLLTTLRDLDLSKNHFFYQIPVELYRNGALASLESLDLSKNLLTGMLYDGVKRIYDFGGSWQKLRTLRLHGNYLGKELPPNSAELYSIPALEVLDLSSNYITGTVPGGMMKLSSMTSLNLAGNQLQGKFPNFLMELSGLNMLGLSENRFEGTLSFNVGKLSTLDFLDLSRSGLSGTLPSELGSLSLLTNLLLSNNSGIQGNIPTEIGRLTLLESLDFSSNEMMSGILPTEFGELVNLEYLDLSRNRFSGSIPNEYGTLTLLRSLRMRTNLLNSTLPEVFANFTQLKHLSLAENKLSGSFSTSIAELRVLTFLDLGGNLLTGSVPSELGLLNSLTTLKLWSNSLTSSIPSEIGNLQDLESLSLTGNSLTGTVPAEFENLTSLIGMSLFVTGLSGSIPSSLCDNVPTPVIRVDCEKVSCSCLSCGCAGDQDIQTEMPTAEPCVQEFAPTILPTRFMLENHATCGTFETISESGSVLDFSDKGVTQIDLPFDFNWGGTMNFSHVEVDQLGTIKMGSVVKEKCYRAITPALFISRLGPPQAITGSLFFLTSESSSIISWEDMRPNDGSNDPYFVNFQIVLYASGEFELRWGEGAYADAYQMLSGAQDTCSEGLRIGATGDPFQFGFIGDGKWPTDQCRLFMPNGEGFYEEMK
mmetsp:Transcript_21952/g.33315  ORF Transcript_21952/g.33315 Transcript_21952/m.33315 type:complete len:1276 (+) Transcript_21952:81-3908(+)|eukprot:CAMPEP_0194242662 /NCGR_PEP_ID=MMETSP0158-20130606/8132_1 /TAXON_ID=33649 /ORGANISM="Thalassionema nitzschioides, Strain L26-B" /LENGTH=1275 /DNA_ID=CAMNT_0038977803 /DNA_START=69 /DNA_END=3896 /DNA_ORIENTATION=+